MTPTSPSRTFPLPLVLATILCTWSASVTSQAPMQAPDTVQWHVAVSPQSRLQPGQRSTLELTGQILEGWHVYGLKQHPDGPTELKFSVDDNRIVQPAGAPTGTSTLRRMDRAFGLEVNYYTDSLKLTLPVLVKPQAAAGKQQLPVSVRFQSCSERICLPPATIHLLVDVNVQPHV